MSRLRDWLRRRRTGAAALLLYTLLAIAMMGPLAPKPLPLTDALDMCNHVSAIVEARNALREGQFPIRVPPHQCDHERYALFQFYGNFPYTLGGAVFRVTHANPYIIWKWLVTGCLIGGGFFTYRCARALTRQVLPALAAGVLFVTAPYLLTDIHGRCAYPEIFSFGLLPAVFYFAWRSFASRGWAVVLASGVTWCLLALSHNITFLFGSAYFGLFFLSYAALRRSLVRRWCRVGAGYAAGWLLAAWYLVPQQMLLPHLCTATLLIPVGYSTWLAPLGVLLAPAVVLPVHLDSPYVAQKEHFGLQVGWLILAAVGVVLAGYWQKGIRTSAQRLQVTRLLMFFGLSLFMTWSPLDFWPWLPQIFSFVQFPYRLLMFVVLFGTLLAASALVQIFQGRMQLGHLVLLVLAAGWSASPYLSPHRGDPSLSVEKEIIKPDIGRGGATTCYRPAAACLLASTRVHPAMDWISPQTGGVVDVLDIHLQGDHWAMFPAPVAGDALEVHGTVLPGAPVPLELVITVDEVVLARPQLPAGTFTLTLPLPATVGKERVRIGVHGEVLRAPSVPPNPRWSVAPSYILSRLAFQAGSHHPVAPKLIPGTQLLGQMQWGHPTVVRLRVTDPSLVQLPVLYYPYILHVELNGQTVPVEHLGRWLALQLPPGDHEIRVRVAGVGWANGLSLAAWTALAVAALGLTLRVWWRRRHHDASRAGRQSLHFFWARSRATASAFDATQRCG
jgi:hypothetical protein